MVTTNPPDQPPADDNEPTHRSLIPLTIAEIRRLLNRALHAKHAIENAIEHALHWSTWRRRHQTDARRAHIRRRLRLQTLRI